MLVDLLVCARMPDSKSLHGDNKNAKIVGGERFGHGCRFLGRVMQWPNEKSLTTWGFAFAVVVLVLTGVVFVVQVVDQQQRSSWMAAHQQGVLEIEGVLSLLKDAPLGQRGYVITGQSQYFNIYRLAAREIPEQIRSIERLSAENPAQHRRVAQLKNLAKEEPVAVDRSIRLRDEGSRPTPPNSLPPPAR